VDESRDRELHRWRRSLSGKEHREWKHRKSGGSQEVSHGWNYTVEPAFGPSRDEIDGVMMRTFSLCLFALLATASLGSSQDQTNRSQSPAASRAWIEESNRHAQLLLDAVARFAPEGAGQLGVPGLDREVTRLTTESRRQQRQATQTVLTRLQALLKEEQNPLVRQDLAILVRSAQNDLRGAQLHEERLVPYTDVTALVYRGIRSLLDAQVAAERRPAAVERLRKYAGLVDGFEPIATQAMRRTREHLNDPKLLTPSRSQVERDLANGAVLLQGIESLLKQYQLDGWLEPLGRLKEQLGAYEQFVRTELLPKARTDFRLPPDLYAFALEQVGVDMAPEPLVKSARAAFLEIQSEMERLAPRVAKARGLQSSDYREVIRALKKEQLVGDAILPHYRKRLEDLEAIVRKEKLVTLPDRAARIRIATDAEAAQTPAPNMRPPRLLGNTGELGEFVLPLNVPAAPGTAAGGRLDDFTFEAASWTLTAHEARPGHEMQFAKMIEAGVSVPRAVFAFNSTNVEGWGLYAEWMMLPHMPAEGQLISLQFRLLRAARAYLDPELHMGRVSPDEARRVLREDVVLSPAMTESEVERYMFRSPAQATSYFYGYTQLQQLRSDVERAKGSRFNALEFHDFILAQGLLPPALLKDAVLKHFTP
jgi:uncharacterized protein (DUF885 family)